MRTIPDPGFAGDDGAVDPAVAAALARYDADPAEHLAALAVVQHARVLVPVVAVLGEVEHDEHGRAHDKTSDMATVLMEGADGRKALLAFTGTASLARWNPRARPVPVALRLAAQSAVQEGADAVVLDVAGPALFPVEGEALRALAAGSTLVRLDDGWGWARPA
ncbi:MAG TPA: SseB family protein [Marmoricola sp.]|nr:SseB family protein [Marmoricola sp.]